MPDEIKRFESAEEAEIYLTNIHLLGPGQAVYLVGVAIDTLRALFADRNICHGTTHDELDGKPLSGNWQDGTDAACPGWWRGHDQAAAKYQAQREDEEKSRVAERENWRALAKADKARIKELEAGFRSAAGENGRIRLEKEAAEAENARLRREYFAKAGCRRE
jgi:hypothetical protein